MPCLRSISLAQEVRVGRDLVQGQRFLQDRQSLERILRILRFLIDVSVKFQHLKFVVNGLFVRELEFLNARSHHDCARLGFVEFVELVELRLVNPHLIPTHPLDDAAHPGWSAAENPSLVCLPCDHAGDPDSGAEATPVRSGVEPPTPTQPR